MPLSRSQQMSRIRGANTKPELLLRKALWARGHRYRVHCKTPAKRCRADIAFLGRRIAIFVDGCQWHGCPDHYARPRSNSDFWGQKLADNVARDRRQTLELEKLGWRVLRLWGHEIVENVDAAVLVVEAVLDGREIQRSVWRAVRVEPLDDAGDEELWHLESIREPSQRRLVERRRWTGRGPRPHLTRKVTPERSKEPRT